MARLPRLCVPGWPHLLLQTGHNRQLVFADNTDSDHYLQWLKEAALQLGVAIHAYGLLDGEARLLVTPSTADGLSRLMQTVGRRYGLHFNRRHNHVGTLWEGRFRTTVVEPGAYLLRCMRYVEEAGLRTSRLHHLGRQLDAVVSDHISYWSLGNTPFEREAAYGVISEHALTSFEREVIEAGVRKGWPLGSEAFLRELEAQTVRRLAPLPRGRPRVRPRDNSDPI